MTPKGGAGLALAFGGLGRAGRPAHLLRARAGGETMSFATCLASSRAICGGFSLRDHRRPGERVELVRPAARIGLPEGAASFSQKTGRIGASITANRVQRLHDREEQAPRGVGAAGVLPGLRLLHPAIAEARHLRHAPGPPPGTRAPRRPPGRRGAPRRVGLHDSRPPAPPRSGPSDPAQQREHARGEVRHVVGEVGVDPVPELVERQVEVGDARPEVRGVEVAQQLRIEAGVEVRPGGDERPARLRHLLAVHGEVAVHGDAVRRLEARRLQHGRPEDGVEPEDVLPDEVLEARRRALGAGSAPRTPPGRAARRRAPRPRSSARAEER